MLFFSENEMTGLFVDAIIISLIHVKSYYSYVEIEQLFYDKVVLNREVFIKLSRKVFYFYALVIILAQSFGKLNFFVIGIALSVQLYNFWMLRWRNKQMRILTTTEGKELEGNIYSKNLLILCQLYVPAILYILSEVLIGVIRMIESRM